MEVDLVAALVAAAAAGGWAALTTVQIRALRGEVKQLRELVTALLDVHGLGAIVDMRNTDGGDRSSGGLLQRDGGSFFGPRPAV